MALETPYSTRTEADTAAANYAGEGGGGGNDGGGGGGQDDQSRSATLSGSIAAPSSVSQGEAFEAAAAITNGGQENVAGTAILGISDGQGKYFRLDSAEVSISPGQEQGVSFAVPRGATGDVPSGSREFAVFASVSPEGSGKVATKGVSVKEGDGGDDSENAREQSNWGQATHVQSLSYGWQLYAQEHKSKDQTRYIIAATTQNGETVYLASDGTVAREPEYYRSAEEIQAAIEAYGQRAENGNVPDDRQPDTTQPRPSPDTVTEAADQRDSGGIGGFLSPLLGPRGSGFGGAHIVAAALVGGGVYVFWKRRNRLSDRQAKLTLGLTAGLLASHAMGVP